MNNLVERLRVRQAASGVDYGAYRECGEAADRIEELEDRLGQAYQMFGEIAADTGIFDMQAGITLLDLLSKD